MGGGNKYLLVYFRIDHTWSIIKTSQLESRHLTDALVKVKFGNEVFDGEIIAEGRGVNI